MREAFGQSFDIPPGYLNTPSIGVPPLCAAKTLADEVHRWRTAMAQPADFDESVAVARAGFARLIGVDASRVAIGTTVSQLVSLISASVPDGTRVLAVAGDFTSVTFPFAAQHNRGITVSEVELSQLVSHVDGHDLVVVSAVQSADGRILDTDGLAAAARAANARVLLDVTQAAGWLPLRLDWAHWVVGGCYKWLMSPRGAAWLAGRPDALDDLIPHSANWYAGDDPWTSIYGLPLRLATDARRLDLSPVWFAHLGAAEVLPWLAALDAEEVRQHCVALADGLLECLELPPAGSAIVSLDLPGAAEALASAGIVASSRAGRTRLGFHLYNTVEDVKLAAEALGPLRQA